MVFSRLWGNWSVFHLFSSFFNFLFSPDYEGIEDIFLLILSLFSSCFLPTMRELKFNSIFNTIIIIKVFSRLWGNWRVCGYFWFLFLHIVFSRLWGNWSPGLLNSQPQKTAFSPDYEGIEVNNIYSLFAFKLSFSPDYEGIEVNNIYSLFAFKLSFSPDYEGIEDSTLGL